MKNENNADYLKKNKLRIMFLILLGLYSAFIFGILCKNYDLSLITMFIIFLLSVGYSLMQIKKRILLFIMDFSIFLFLLDRPIINLLYGSDWIYFSKTTIVFTLLSLLISISLFNLGFIVEERYNMFSNAYRKLKNKRNKNFEFKWSININFMKKIALFLFLISFCCTMVMEIDKLLFMQGKDYAQVYSLYKNEFPIVIRVMSTILPYFLCFFLACNPNKKSTYIVLIVYIVSGLPGFIIGARSALMIKVMFSFLYFMIRENNDNIEVWINKFEKIILIVMVPVSIIGLGAFSYIRDGSNSNSDNRNILVDFFYLQGTSFDTLCEAFEFKDELKTKDVTSYTFGNIIDYVQHSTMSQILFNAEPLPSGNNITMATKSNSLAHHLSYVVLGDTYLMGHGRGSSYIAEVYLDFGFFGIAIYNFILGIFLSIVIKIMKTKSLMGKVIILIILTDMFMIPRDAAISFIDFLLTGQFWIAVCMMYSTYFILKKFNERMIKHE